MRNNAAAPPLLAAAILLLPLLLYFVGYYSLLDLSAPWQYRLGGQVSFRLFWPVEQIDRKLRPGVWELDQSRKPSSVYLELYEPSPSIVPAEDNAGC